VTEAELIEQARIEIESTDKMFNVIRTVDGRDKLTPRDVLRRRQEFGFDDRDLQQLWVYSRLLGVTHWWLAQLDCAPETVPSYH
jgi:hypothetical protein